MQRLHALFSNRQIWWWVFYYVLIALLRFSFDIKTLWWLGGGVVAAAFIVVDRLVYAYWLRPHEHLSIHLQHLIKQRRWTEAITLLYRRRGEQQRLIGLSALFLVGWLVVAVFLLTSSVSWLAQGLVMGVGLRPVIMSLTLWQQPQALKEKLLWQINRPLTDHQVRLITGSFITMFGVLSLWVTRLW